MLGCSRSKSQEKFRICSALLSAQVYLPEGPGSWYKINDALLSGASPLPKPIKVSAK